MKSAKSSHSPSLDIFKVCASFIINYFPIFSFLSLTNSQGNFHLNERIARLEEEKKKQLDYQLTEYPIKIQSRSSSRKVPSSKTKYRSVGPPILSNPNRSVAMICTRKKTTWKVYNAALLKSKQKNCGFSSKRIYRFLFDVPLISIRDDCSVKMKISLKRY